MWTSQKPAPLLMSLWICTLLWFLFRQFQPSWTRSGRAEDILHNPCSFWALGLLLVSFDRLLLFPWLRSSLRRGFPTVFINHLTTTFHVLTEEARGKMALNWMMDFPDADAIHTHGIVEGSVVIPISPRALRDTLSVFCYDFVKPRAFAGLLVNIAGSGLVFTEGDAYLRRRKIMYPPMNPSNIHELYPAVRTKAQAMVDRMSKAVTNRDLIDVMPFVFRYVLDSTCNALLSYDLDALGSQWDDKNVIRLERSMTPSRQATAFAMLAIVLPSWLFSTLPIRQSQSIPRQGKHLRRFCKSILTSIREQNSTSQPSSAHPFRNVVNSGLLTNDEAVEEILTVLIAGIETTTSALLWTLQLLSMPRYAHFQEAIRLESHHVLESGHPTHSTMRQLPFLNGVLEEILRLYPPIPLTWRETLKDSTIAGQSVPKGTHIALHIYALNRHPGIWGENADEMDPYRWIQKDRHGSYQFKQYSSVDGIYDNFTFLHGPRGCIGKEFGKVSLRTAMVEIFHRFRVTQFPQVTGVPTCGLIVTRPKQGPILSLKPLL